ncbi:retinol dehydrogenase 7-like [Amphiura filiformis]|uniref:retinol dehydrogenase 7-like n=1 Tax=Amphiura filiformis TaxID=82378 RepID=UPI003B219431
MEFLSLAFLVVFVFLVSIWLLDKIKINISGRYVLITGCDTGFGNLIAKQLDKKGCHVFAACFTEKGASDLRAASSNRLKTVQMDVTKSESIEAAYEIVKAGIPANKGLWGVINNAGVTGNPGQYNWWTREEIRSIIEVNLLGVVEVTNVFLPLIKKAKGRIVNVSSSLGIYTIPTGGYEMAKHGVEAFSDGLRILMKPYGVTVHILEPGYFRTEVTNTEGIFPRMDKAWNRLTPEEREEYGEEYYQDLKNVMAEILDNATDKLYLVTDAMEHALTAWWPWRRYLPGLDAKLLYKPLSMLPAILTDNLDSIFRIKTPTPKVCKKL